MTFPFKKLIFQHDIFTQVWVWGTVSQNSVYWGKDKKTFEDIEVELVSTESSSTFIMRNMLIHHVKVTRQRPTLSVLFVSIGLWCGRAFQYHKPFNVTSVDRGKTVGEWSTSTSWSGRTESCRRNLRIWQTWSRRSGTAVAAIHRGASPSWSTASKTPSKKIKRDRRSKWAPPSRVGEGYRSFCHCFIKWNTFFKSISDEPSTHLEVKVPQPDLRGKPVWVLVEPFQRLLSRNDSGASFQGFI